jgi:hypothetical protein
MKRDPLIMSSLSRAGRSGGILFFFCHDEKTTFLLKVENGRSQLFLSLYEALC